jgi:hypothetical protein
LATGAKKPAPPFGGRNFGADAMIVSPTADSVKVVSAGDPAADGAAAVALALALVGAAASPGTKRARGDAEHAATPVTASTTIAIRETNRARRPARCAMNTSHAGSHQAKSRSVGASAAGPEPG